MQTHEITTYSYAELSDDAKERAVRRYAENGIDYEWWENTVEDAKEIGRLMGMDIAHVYFSGFWSQGDGACFEGEYCYTAGGAAAVADMAEANDWQYTEDGKVF